MLQGRDFLSLADLSADELQALLDFAADLKARQKRGEPHRLLEGCTLAMIFEKPSLRTRATFETGMAQLGGHAIDLAREHLQMGVRESVPDVARNLERWVDAIMARVFAHSTLEELARYARIPVINGLSDYSHPCQILSDLLTIREHKGELAGRTLAYVGDGNNVCHSLLFGGALTGMHVRVGCPEGYEPLPSVVEQARRLAGRNGACIELTHDPREAVSGADVVYTDSWVSMGQEAERELRIRVFPPYQVNARLLQHARPDAVVMHCLPAHRGEEITDDVMDGPQSIIFDQAENRLHAQKALLVALIRGL